MAIKNDGAVQFNAYNSTNKTGTPTYLLGTDASGNVVKTNTVPGSGAGPYLPLAGGTMTGDILLSEHSVKFDQSGTRSWDISAGSGNLNITSGDSGGNVFLSPGLVVEDATTVGGNLTVTGNQYFNGSEIQGDSKTMLRYSDAWLRINEDNDFSSGIYCGTGILRTDGHFQVGNVGDKFEINSAGDIRIRNRALINQQENTDVDTGTETVANVLISSYTAAFFDFVIKNGTNVRSGTVYACHDGTNVEFTETSTNDLGDTSDVTLSVDISGGNMRLRATTTSDDWSVKSLIRAI